MTCLPKRVRSVPVGSADLFDQSGRRRRLSSRETSLLVLSARSPANLDITLVSVDKYGCIRERAPVEPAALAFRKRKSAYME